MHHYPAYCGIPPVIKLQVKPLEIYFFSIILFVIWKTEGIFKVRARYRC